MNNIIKVLLVVFISFLSSPSWSETVSGDELVTNPSDGLVYKKFTTDPFTGSTPQPQIILQKVLIKKERRMGCGSLSMTMD